MPKPWQPLNVLIAAEEALAPARQGLISAIRRLQTLRESVCQLSGQCPLSGGRGTQSQQHDVIGQEWRTRKGPGEPGPLVFTRQDGPLSASGFWAQPRKGRTCPRPCTRASVQFYSDIPSTYRRPGSRLWKPEIDGQRLCRRAFLRDEEAHPKRRGALQDAR